MTYYTYCLSSTFSFLPHQSPFCLALYLSQNRQHLHLVAGTVMSKMTGSFEEQPDLETEITM